MAEDPTQIATLVDSPDPQDTRVKEHVYDGVGYAVHRPSTLTLTMMIMCRSMCWCFVVAAWLLKDDLVLFIPLMGLYWCIFDGTSVIGCIETRVCGLPVVESPSQRTAHGFLWVCMAFYLLKQRIELK